MSIISKLIFVIEKINETVGNIVKLLLLYMALTLTYEVIARYVFNSPTIWVFEICKHAMLYMGALGGGYTLMMNGHVKVDVIYSMLSLRGRAIIDILTSVLFFLYMSIMLWKCTELAISSWGYMEHSTTALGAPIYTLKTAIPIGAFLVILQGFVKLLKDILVLITNREQEYRTLNY